MIVSDERRRYTRGEWEAIANRLVSLITVKLPEAEVRLRRVDMIGDLDDDYDDAVDDHRDVHWAIETLAKTLGMCETISAESAAHADYVRFGSKVVVRTEGGEIEAYQISSPYGEIPERGRLHAGIQDATFGKRVGDMVSVKTPIQTYRVEIVRIEQHPAVLREANAITPSEADAE